LSRKKLLNPKEVKSINNFNLEMNAGIGTKRETSEYSFMDDDFRDDEIYVDTGDLIPREIIEEAERQFANKRHERLY